MFGSASTVEKKKADKKKVANTAKNHGLTIITSGCSFEGNLICRGNSRIGGKVTGNITSEGMLIIEETAEIHADINAEIIIIHGQVTGEVNATQSIEMCSNSILSGRMKAPRIVIQPEAIFNGSCEMPFDPSKNNRTQVSRLNLASKPKEKNDSAIMDKKIVLTNNTKAASGTAGNNGPVIDKKFPSKVNNGPEVTTK